MRVISGTAKGRRLKTPSGHDVRPTSELVKEAVASMIQFEIEGSRVLDIFCGTGQMGIEFLSRGARSAVFVDSSKDSCAMALQNISLCGLSDRARVVTSEASAFLRSCRQRFDICFLDPPYRVGLLQEILPLVFPLIEDYGTVICESSSDDKPPLDMGSFSVFRSYRYGKTLITLYRHQNNQED